MPIEKGTGIKQVKNANEIAGSLSERNKSKRIPGGVTRGARPTIAQVNGTGFERVTATGEGGGGAGITSPVTEPTAATRTFFPIPRTIVSTDGVFSIEIRDLKTIDMVDADGNEVQFVFAQPN